MFLKLVQIWSFLSPAQVADKVSSLSCRVVETLSRIL